MKIKYLLKVSLYLIFFLFLGCTGTQKKPTKVQEKKAKPDKEIHYLHLRHSKPIAILRLECEDCILTYNINNKDFVISLKNGTQDKFLYPENRTTLKTQLSSKADQLIRVLLIDPNGNILYNVIDHFKKGELRQNKYLIQYKKWPDAVIINTK